MNTQINSPSKLELYYFEECPFCVRVLKVVKELKVPLTLKNTLTNPENRAKLIKDTGMSQVPCLYIDDKPMFESSDIIQWLRSHF